MAATQTILLASYPRSGNSLLRTILKGAFNLVSSTVYTTEGYDSEIGDKLGHVDNADAEQMAAHNDGLMLIKTHEYLCSDTPAIYMVRDGREASISYMKFSQQLGGESYTLDDVIAGRCRYNAWSDHLRAWNPATRPNTLVLRCEDVAMDTDSAVAQIASFIGREPVGLDVPSFSEMRDLNYKFFRAGTNATWRDHMTDEQHERFWKMHGQAMRCFGYTKDACVTAGAGEKQYV